MSECRPKTWRGMGCRETHYACHVFNGGFMAWCGEVCLDAHKPCYAVIASCLRCCAIADADPYDYQVRQHKAEIKEGISRQENSRLILEFYRSRDILFWLDEQGKIHSKNFEVLTPQERYGMGLCKQVLTEALRREQGRCTRCNEPHKQGDRQDLCHACIMELGWPHYLRLSSKRHAKEETKEVRELPPWLEMVEGGEE